ncbi:uncharacterized protein PHACADRAFT_211670 [Phanerochaete carnosa HHB-10118-sp]|uniref:Tubulin nucleotide-binding domain-like protein n=1 Tax=Phanerochaete carnosa (strain HHB-10118-sp) TaxID=650164 RepID=K5WQ03_PHACS|nr:uncharacterized protein PHACADRAFT_211670 [Phanerochaete carnosa HHB-10118-sp]EKM52417.1 hypothetical protein PHACADRAFT_211670 [Phanerochaete carnosa HHB-10118-sp]
MREILYFQAGRVSNFIGTHFWNAQENCFTYEDDAQESLVNHDVSFREGLNQRGDSTFCPRLLLFDHRSNFGALSDISGDTKNDADDVTALWSGETVQYCSEPIRRSEYHVQLEADGDESRLETDDQRDEAQVNDSKVQYWSDYSRVYLHPRSVHRLPDLPDWDDAEGDWVNSSDTFQKYDEDNDFMEDSFRIFVEECDHLQGFQTMNDSLTFGGFTHSFLTRFRDDFAKLPCLSFPVLSGSVPGMADVDDSRAVGKALNDALLLQSLSDLSTLTVPIQPPSLWSSSTWLRDLNLTFDSVYQTSAILATHVEDVTLPMRLKYDRVDMASLASSLSWSNDKLFADLQGAFPLFRTWDTEGFPEPMVYNFSTVNGDGTTCVDAASTYARMNVSRGFSEVEKKSFMGWAECFRPEPYTLHAPAIELPSSFPRFFVSSSSSSSVPPHQARSLSSLSSGASLSSLFGAYGAVAKDCLGQRRDVVTRMGLEVDDVRELRDNLWALEDAYKIDEEVSDDDELGEDEET